MYFDVLKTLIVKPKLKKDKEDLMENYKPISILSIISKIFEKYIYNKLNLYLEKSKILSSEQKGFRKNKTSNIAVFDFLYYVMQHVDNRTPICTIFCDITRTFEYLDQNIKIKKLDAYEMRGNVLALIQQFKKNR